MPATKCPLCDSPCIVKIVSAGDKRFCEVDVCSTCGTMYARGEGAKAAPAKKARPAKAKSRAKK